MAWNGSNLSKSDHSKTWNELKSPSKTNKSNTRLFLRILLTTLLLVAISLIFGKRSRTSQSDDSNISNSVAVASTVKRLAGQASESKFKKVTAYPAAVSNALVAVDKSNLLQIGKKVHNKPEVGKPRAYKTGVEQVLGWISRTELGVMPLPLPKIYGRDRSRLASILINRDVISVNDNDELAGIKADLNYAKDEMAKFIRNGGSPDEFINYYYNELKKAFEIRQEAKRQLSRLEDKDPELAEMFANAVNEKFEEQGIKKLPHFQKE